MTRQKTTHHAGEQRRREIALAAKRIIAEKGLEGLRMRAIADEVGINIATLHYHVTTKDDLLVLVTDEIRADFIAQHGRHRSAAQGALARLRREFADFRENRTENPVLSAVLAELYRAALRDPEVARRILPMRAAWTSQFSDILEAGVEEGVFRADLDIPAFAAVIVAALSGFDAGAAATDPALMQRVFAELTRSVLSPSAKESFDG